MANLNEQSSWEAGIYQLERSDPVDAGVNGNGVDNLQAKQLANRTRWLKDTLQALSQALTNHQNAADPYPQYAKVNTPQALIDEDTELGLAHNGLLIFVLVGEGTQRRITVADGLPDGWGCLIVQVDAGRVRIDAGSEPLLTDGNNVLTKAGTAATLNKLNDAFEINDFWLSGACTEYREDLELPDGTPLGTEGDETLEL